ncbi:MAG: hypothetical protein IJH87_03080 [Atopobiaceae bacterium]|nr:hypothetical protein [Atopobiaceae bacterium]
MDTKEKLVDELLKHIPDEAVELSDAQLENVAGGVITKTGASLIMNAINMVKPMGTTLEQALEAIPMLYDQLIAAGMYKDMLLDSSVEEISEFVKANW